MIHCEAGSEITRGVMEARFGSGGRTAAIFKRLGNQAHECGFKKQRRQGRQKEKESGTTRQMAVNASVPCLSGRIGSNKNCGSWSKVASRSMTVPVAAELQLLMLQ